MTSVDTFTGSSSSSELSSVAKHRSGGIGKQYGSSSSMYRMRSLPQKYFQNSDSRNFAVMTLAVDF
jgi:hypothetical protein